MTAMMRVYVPADPTGRSGAGGYIASGAAIVGSERDEGGIGVDYEGAIYRQSGMRTFADRCYYAHSRRIVLYPTVARAVLPATALVPVGWFHPGPEGDWRSGRVEVDPGRERLLAEWLGVEELGPELVMGRE
ncbi:MAG TPA: hypothetical protein VG265_14145 [Gaiellaceae bacterium]|jgi:hypothetical protein|nr:hypothetical protein [Gaiellaceae bacterium]